MTAGELHPSFGLLLSRYEGGGRGGGRVGRLCDDQRLDTAAEEEEEEELDHLLPTREIFIFCVQVGELC